MWREQSNPALTRRSNGKISTLIVPDFCILFVTNANQVIAETCWPNQSVGVGYTVCCIGVAAGSAEGVDVSSFMRLSVCRRQAADYDWAGTKTPWQQDERQVTTTILFGSQWLIPARWIVDCMDGSTWFPSYASLSTPFEIRENYQLYLGEAAFWHIFFLFLFRYLNHYLNKI